MHLQWCRVVACCLLLALLTGCSPFVREPIVAIKDATIAGLDGTGIDVQIHLGVTNHNSFNLSLLDYTYDLRAVGLPLSSGGGQQPLIFPPDRETDVHLPVRLKYTDLLEIINRTPNPARIPCRISSRLHVDTPLGETVILVEKETLVDVPEQYRPSYYFERLRGVINGLH